MCFQNKRVALLADHAKCLHEHHSHQIAVSIPGRHVERPQSLLGTVVLWAEPQNSPRRGKASAVLQAIRWGEQLKERYGEIELRKMRKWSSRTGDRSNQKKGLGIGAQLKNHSWVKLLKGRGGSSQPDHDTKTVYWGANLGVISIITSWLITN